MLLLFLFRVAEWLPVGERAVYSVFNVLMCLSSICVCSSSPFGLEGGIWDFVV